MAKKETGMTKWDEQLARLAQQTKATEKSAAVAGNFIGKKGGTLTFGGAEIPGNSIDVVIIDSILENKYYGEAYDPDDPQPPVCFALGRDNATMKPHEKSTDPQHATCKGCKQNDFGTAEKGKGKACQNTRRLGLIVEGDLKDPVAAQTAYYNPQVTSVKAYAGYVDNLANTLNRPPLAVVTTLSLLPDKKNQHRTEFKLKSRIEDGEVFEGLLQKNKLEQEAIMFPYQPREKDEESHNGTDNKQKKFAKKRK